MRAFKWFSRKTVEPAEAPAGKGGQKRRFDAASTNRLLASWLRGNQDINEMLRGDLDVLVARSRDLAKNNDYVRKFLRMVATNVVGPQGFTLQCAIEDRPGVTDDAANDAVEAAFREWSRVGTCDTTGRLSFVAICRLLIVSAARDGEYLVRMVKGTAARNKFNFALQVLSPTRIDTKLNQERANGRRRIVMGIELDDYDRPLFYHLLTNSTSLTREHDVVPADDILHGFLQDEPEQIRAYPWLATAMIRLHHLKGYDEAAIIAARVGAAKMGFFVQPEGGAPGDLGEDEGDGDFSIQAEAGTFDVVPSGYDFKSYDPDYPHQQYAAFVKAALRGISSGLGVSYNSLANDLEGVNFSSIRSGVLEEREEWMALQGWFAESFLAPVFHAWLEMALAGGMVKLPSGSALPFDRREKYRAHRWQPRRWKWVDPLKEMQAMVLATAHAIDSPQNVIEGMGGDPESIIRDLKEWQEMLTRYGVTLQPATGSKPSATPAAPDDQDDDDAQT